jgi:hypothetical protein
MNKAKKHGFSKGEALFRPSGLVGNKKIITWEMKSRNRENFFRYASGTL